VRINRNEEGLIASKADRSNVTNLISSSPRFLTKALAIAAAFVFVLLASYRIELPGLYMDEVDFVNAARGAPDNTMIHMRVGPVPLFIMPYLGALKAWIYAPIFGVFGVSPLTIRLPAIILAAMTLLILFQLIEAKLGAAWGVISVWIMAVDPVNLFPSRLDWGPTVLMHFFEAAIFGLWFSYRSRPKLWKIILIVLCAALGFFDKFNFIWLVVAFSVAVTLCYPDSLKHLWLSTPKFWRWAAAIVSLIGVLTVLFLVWRVLHVYAGKALELGLHAKWEGLLSALSGDAVAYFLFGNNSGIITFLPFWLIVIDCCLVLGWLFFPSQDTQARENGKNGLFFSLIGFLVFLQIVITPQAGGPHHYLMIFPLPLLAFVFLAQALHRRIRGGNLGRFAMIVLLVAAASMFVVNVHNTWWYLTRLRTGSQYNPRWSPAIYSLSDYINAHGFEAQRVISTDWGLHNQLHALAPEQLRSRIRDCWPIFMKLDTENQEQQAVLSRLFPEGKTLALTFAAPNETFPETQRNFLQLLASHPELKYRLLKEFWYGGQKIYQIYEIDRSQEPGATHSAWTPAIHDGSNVAGGLFPDAEISTVQISSERTVAVSK